MVYINSNKMPSVKLGMLESIQFTTKMESPKVLVLVFWLLLLCLSLLIDSDKFAVCTSQSKHNCAKCVDTQRMKIKIFVFIEPWTKTIRYSLLPIWRWKEKYILNKSAWGHEDCNILFYTFSIATVFIILEKITFRQMYRYFNIVLFSNLFHYIKQKIVGIFLLYSRNIIAWQLTLFIFSKIENCI